MRTRMVNGRPQWIVFDLNSPLSHYADAAAEAAAAASTSFDAAASASFDAAAAFEEGIADEYEEDPAAYEDEAVLFDNHVAALFEEANATRMALMNDSHTLQNAAIASAAAVAAAASSIVVSSSEVLPAVTSSLSVNAAAASPESVKFAFPWMYQALPPIAKPMNFLIENYEQLSVIRHGRDSDVIKARESTTGMIVAVKRCMIYGWGHPKSTAQDISLFKSLLDSKYMAKLLNVKQLDGNAYFVFEYLQYNLKEAMTFHRTEILTFNSRPETAEKIRILLYQLCKAILYLHDNGIIHCALRPDNILVDMMIYRLKIADFNPGKTFNIIHNQREDTDKILGFKYIPPEILLGAPHSTQGDMWNVGLIFAELLRGRKLFDAHVKVTSKAEQLKIMFSIWGTPTEETWPRIGKIISKYNYRKHKPFKEIIPTAGTYGFDLLTKMLCYDPSRRISAKEALDHPYFNSINKSEFD